jgi:hypothetical protein
MSREITSFSRIEFEMVRDSGALDVEILEGQKLIAMKNFRDDLPALTQEINATVGAFSNLKTIRVMEGYLFLYTPTLPPMMFLRQKEAEAAKVAAAKRGEAAVVATVEAKVEQAEKAAKDSRPSRRDGKSSRGGGTRKAREEFLRSPEGARAAFGEARKQAQQQEKDRLRKIQQNKPQPKPVEVVRLPTQIVKRAS